MTDDELDMVETDLLLDSLGRRNLCVVLIEVFAPEPGAECACVSFRGGYFQALGAVALAKNQLINKEPRKMPEQEENH